MKTKRPKLVEMMDHQLWLLNQLQCVLNEVLGEVMDNIVDARLSIRPGRPDRTGKDERKDSHTGTGSSEEEDKWARIPAREEQISQLLDQGVFQGNRWLSVRDADLWMHYLSERED